MEQKQINNKKLDYTIQSPEERSEFVKNFLNNEEIKVTEKYAEILSDYIISAIGKEERKERKILTDNRLVTINKRETSYQGLVSKFENGEDGLFNIMTEDKNVILTPKTSITEKDIEEIQPLKELKEAIEVIKEQEKKALGKKKYLLKKQLIEMCQEQYSIKNDFRNPMYSSNTVKSFVKADLSERYSIGANGEPISNGLISLFNPKHISVLLCNYSLLKEESWGKFENDSYYLMEDLDNLIERTLKEKYPYYYKLVIYKIDGKQNNEIQDLLKVEFGIKHSVEYISSLWRNKIPKILAEQEKKDYLIWHYTNVEYGKWKRCTRCNQMKLINNMFFSINSTSKDGYYSICKECRNQKKEG